MSTPQERIRVLVVEDNETNRKVVGHMLKKLGCEVDMAEDGVEGVAAAQTGYALIFMDISMPRMDGFAASAAIRAMPPPAGHTPIVALTAHATAEDRLKCLAAGMDLWLPKPIVVDDLARAVERFTGWKEGMAPVDKGAVLDEAVVAQLLALQDPGEPDFLDGVASDFREACGRAVDIARRMHDGGLYPELRVSMRRVTDAARAVGALRVTEIAERIEAADDDTLADRGMDWLDTMDSETLRASVALLARK